MSSKDFPGKTKRRRSGHGGWPVQWDKVQMPETDDEAVALVANSPKRFELMLARLRAAVEAGQRRNASRLSRLALRSDSAKIAALSYALSQKAGAVKRRFHADDPDWRARKVPGIAGALITDALALDLWAGTNELTVWVVKMQPNGKCRLNYMSELLEYARQYLALRVAKTMAVISPRQFILRGGTPALVEWMTLHVPQAKVVMTTDIPRCFYVLNRARVEADMPLPGRVMKRVLFDPMDQAKEVPLSYGCDHTLITPSHYGCEAGSGWGIPPGSALAALAAEVSLRHILEAVENAAEGVVVASYGDNIIILAPSAKAAAATKDALCEAASVRIRPDAVEGLRTRIVTSTPKKGFFFVGSQFAWKKGGLQRRRPPAYFDAFRLKLDVDLTEHKIDEAGALRRIAAWAKANNFDPQTAKIAAQIINDWGLAG